MIYIIQILTEREGERALQVTNKADLLQLGLLLGGEAWEGGADEEGVLGAVRLWGGARAGGVLRVRRRQAAQADRQERAFDVLLLGLQVSQVEKRLSRGHVSHRHAVPPAVNRLKHTHKISLQSLCVLI